MNDNLCLTLKTAKYNDINVLHFNGKEWFICKQISHLLGHYHPSDMTNLYNHIPETHKQILSYDDILEHFPIISNVKGDILICDEVGLYNILIRSESPIADDFLNWISKTMVEVRREIPKLLNDDRKNKLNKLKEECDSLEKLIRRQEVIKDNLKRKLNETMSIRDQLLQQYIENMNKKGMN